MTMRRIFHNHRIHSSSEGTPEISQLRSGWQLSKNTFLVPEGRPANGHYFSRPSGTYPMTNLFPALKRRAIFGKSLWDRVLFAVIFILFSAAGAMAETTNTLSDAEIQGRQLAQQLCEAKPETGEKLISVGTLSIRKKTGGRSEIALRFQIWANDVAYSTIYEATSKTNQISLSILHFSEGIKYSLFNGSIASCETNKPFVIDENETMVPFADSDFWICDLGFEFFHWPAQKILPKPTNLARGRDYTLLESTNPNPSTNGYSRVRSWIDKETGGILQAEAYDFNGKLLKEFAPKSFKKVNGQWQLQEMEIRNVQTGSRTRLEFDLKK
jgi:hypothetical protein